MINSTLAERYQISHRLGRGGFAETYLAKDLYLPDHPPCVVKRLQPQQTDETTLQVARRLFDREARVLYQLGDHERIPRLFAHFEREADFFLVQEFIEGYDLSREILLGRPWSEANVFQLLEDILEVLDFVHTQQIIHRDLKPQNMMRRPSDQKIVLIDFGAVKQLAQVTPETFNQEGWATTIGSVGYMPIEQLSGNPRLSSDIYAVGVTAIQALTGIPIAQMMNAETGEVRWQDPSRPVSPRLADYLDRMVAYDWRARFGSANEALMSLRAIKNVGQLMRQVKLFARRVQETMPTKDQIAQGLTTVGDLIERTRTDPKATAHETTPSEAPTVGEFDATTIQPATDPKAKGWLEMGTRLGGRLMNAVSAVTEQVIEATQNAQTEVTRVVDPIPATDLAVPLPQVDPNGEGGIPATEILGHHGSDPTITDPVE